MPEGDTIYRTATTLRPAIEGRRIDAAHLRDPLFEAETIVGATVAAVEARGKHLLIHLTSLGAIHSHMGMTGSWHIYRPGDPWCKPRQYAVLVMAINSLEVICFSPKQLELLTANQLRAHAHLRNLGPDLLAVEYDAAAAVARFRAHNSVPLGEAVMNQTIVSGIGNIYKSELLFILRLDPFAPVAAFTDEELAQLTDKARRLMRQNSATHRRQTRFTGEGQRMWVYSRPGEQCAKCAAPIQVRRQGEAGRTTFWCPTCQQPR